MYGALYTKLTPTREALGSHNASGVHSMAKAMCGSQVGLASTRWGPVGVVNHERRLAVETVLRDSSSTCFVKPRAPKYEPESLVCSLSLTVFL